jgi:hypothetical protein
MFQRELQSTLGADYMDRTQRNRNTGKEEKERGKYYVVQFQCIIQCSDCISVLVRMLVSVSVSYLYSQVQVRQEGNTTFPMQSFLLNRYGIFPIRLLNEWES